MHEYAATLTEKHIYAATLTGEERWPREEDEPYIYNNDPGFYDWLVDDDDWILVLEG